MRLEINADLGEGSSSDAALMAWIQRANIACGGHAGDAESMLLAVRMAQQHGVLIGAHPSYPDRGHFGRVETQASAAQIEADCFQQLCAFNAVVRQCQARVAHVKAHGALYHRIMSDTAAAQAFLRAVQAAVGVCAIVGLPDSVLHRVCKTTDWPYLTELFADRRYEADGSLTPRSHPQALLVSTEDAVAQVLSVRDKGGLVTRAGDWLAVQADTICVHGDGDSALDLVRALAKALSD